jgi:hypothetical protein
MSNIQYKDLSDLRKQAKPLRPARIAEPSWDTMCETVSESQLIATLESHGITLTKAAPKKKAEKKEESKPKEKKSTTKSKATSSKGKKQKR